MFLCMFLLVLVNACTCSGNRFAADAIQYAIFGDTSSGNQTESEQSTDAPIAQAETASPTATTSTAPTHFGVAHIVVNTSPKRIMPWNYGYPALAVATAWQPTAGQPGSQGRPISQGSRRRGPNTTTPPSKAQQRVFSGPSYSFAQLSAMSANSAPSQVGNFYVPREFERIPRVEPCQAVKCHLSIAIVMDSSGSVGYTNYQKELSFVMTLLEIMAVKAADSKLKVCTGLVSYSTYVHVEVDPCCENSICRVVDQFRAGRLQYRDGSTNTHGALKVARQMLQAAASYKKVALLITDGKSNTGGSPVPFARRMRAEDGIQIVALGVTNDVNKPELTGVSGLDRVTKIDVFDEFHELATRLLQANEVASHHHLETSFEEMCYLDKSSYRSTQCVRVMTEEQKSQCVWGDWSNCVRHGNTCSATKTCKLNAIVISEESQACECPPCLPGSALTKTGHCRQCEANTYSNSDFTACVSCSPHQFSDPGSSSVKQCLNEFDVVDEDGHVVTGEEGGLLLYKGGTVCNDYFSDTAANAICRKMGRPYGLASWKSGRYYSLQSRKSIKLDDVRCSSDSWDSCSFTTVHNNCSHSNDVHITCKGNIFAKSTRQAPTKEATTNREEVTETATTSSPYYTTMIRT